MYRPKKMHDAFLALCIPLWLRRRRFLSSSPVHGLPPIYNRKGEIRMHTRIIQTPPHIHQKHLHLRLLPSKTMHKRPLTNRRQPFHQDHAQEPNPLFALASVFSPAADGELVAYFGDVVEPLGAQEVGETVDGVEVETELGEA